MVTKQAWQKLAQHKAKLLVAQLAALPAVPVLA
jgi:hypothetical protein